MTVQVKNELHVSNRNNNSIKLGPNNINGKLTKNLYLEIVDDEDNIIIVDTVIRRKDIRPIINYLESFLALTNNKNNT